MPCSSVLLDSLRLATMRFWPLRSVQETAYEGLPYGVMPAARSFAAPLVPEITFMPVTFVVADDVEPDVEPDFFVVVVVEPLCFVAVSSFATRFCGESESVVPAPGGPDDVPAEGCSPSPRSIVVPTAP